jgi:hypothetical protein
VASGEDGRRAVGTRWIAAPLGHGTLSVRRPAGSGQPVPLPLRGITDIAGRDRRGRRARACRDDVRAQPSKRRQRRVHTFRGRLKGGLIPPGGKLVELQVFTRRRWRTFAQPRASATTGRWSFQYRFEAVRGRVRFRFRARIRREASYPFHVGTSRQVPVTVHGI